MKIIEIIPTLISGGAERFVVDLSNELSRRVGVEVILLTLYDRSEKAFLFDEVDKKVRIKSLGKHRGFDCRIVFRVLSFLKKERPDVVHTHVGAFPYTFFSMPFIKAKFFHTVHNDAFKEAHGIDRVIKKFAFRHHMCVPVTISNESHASFVKLYRRETAIIYNGCTAAPNHTADLTKYRKSSNTKVFVNVARIIRQKNQIVLAEAASRLISEGADMAVLFVGRIEDESFYDELTRYLSDRIIYLGEVKEPRAILATADYFCLPSVHEGMPISLLEAFSVGCIPVCSPAGGCKDAIRNGINGILGAGHEEQAVYQMLKSAVEMPAHQYRAMRKAALESFTPYSMETCASRYLKLFSGE